MTKTEISIENMVPRKIVVQMWQHIPDPEADILISEDTADLPSNVNITELEEGRYIIIRAARDNG